MSCAHGAGRNGMKAAKAAALMIGGAVLAALATSAAHAASPSVREILAANGVEMTPVAQGLGDVTATQSPLSLAPAPHRTLQLDSKGRWGFRLDMDQPTARDQDFRDVQAGAYYRIGRGLRVGGSLGFGPSAAPQNMRPQDDAAPRVRLESNFKF